MSRHPSSLQVLRDSNIELTCDGKPVGDGRIDATVPMIYSGTRLATWDPTLARRSVRTTTKSSRFNGKVNWVKLEIGNDNHDHLISPEELMRVAIAMQ